MQTPAKMKTLRRGRGGWVERKLNESDARTHESGHQGRAQVSLLSKKKIVKRKTLRIGYWPFKGVCHLDEIFFLSNHSKDFAVVVTCN